MGESFDKEAQRLSSLQKIRDRKFLEIEYVEKKKSADTIAVELGISATAVLDSIKRLGIPIRTAYDIIISDKDFVNKKPYRGELFEILDRYGIEHTPNYVVRDTYNEYVIDEYLPKFKIFMNYRETFWNKTKLGLLDIFVWKFLRNKFPDHKVVYVLESDFGDGVFEKTVQELVNPISKSRKWDKTEYVFHKTKNDNIAKFVKKHHYIGSVPPATYVFMATKNDEIVAAASFSKGFKYGKYCMELIRYCSSEHNTNLGSWFLGKCIRNIKERPVLTYADITRYPGKPSHEGTLYKACNFKFIGLTEHDYKWIKPDGTYLHSRSLWERANRNGVIERVQAKKENLTKIYEWPKFIYIYE